MRKKLGRPQLCNDDETDFVGFKIPKKAKEKFQGWCKRNAMSVSARLQLLVRRDLKDSEKLGEF